MTLDLGEPQASFEVSKVPVEKIALPNVRFSTVDISNLPPTNPAPFHQDGSVNEDAEMEDLTERMHRSLFLIPSQASFLYDEWTMERASVRHVMDDLTLKEYAKSFPPELDFDQAQKYLLQLADGIPDTLGSPRASASSSGLSHRRITTPGSNSEYTEIIVEHDDDDVRIDPRMARTSPNGHGGGLVAPCYSPKESVFSNDYTEIVVESWGEDEIIVEEIIEEEEAY